MKNDSLQPTISTEARATQRPLFFLFIAALLLMYFLHLGGWAYFDADEGRYGNVAREMLVNSDWITPTQNQIKFFDKPPLLYWGMAASYGVFGVQEWAGRLIPTLAALMGVLFAWVLGRRMFGPRTGFLAAVILATSLMWPIMARVVVTDMLVSSLVFITLALWWLGHSETGNHKKQTLWFLGFWSTLACAMLAKGPVTLVLIGGSVFFYLLICRQWRASGQMRWLMGIPVFFLIAAPWFVLIALRNPEFNYYFWYDQHIARFLGKSISGADHIKGPDYYVKLLPVILFPWTFFIPAAFFAALKFWKQPNSPRRSAGLFLLSGVFFILLFFHSTSSKLITYLLPIIPLIAILLAAYFDRMLSHSVEKSRALLVGAGVLGAALVVGAIAAFVIAPAKIQEMGVAALSVQIVALLLLMWGVAVLVCAVKKQQSAVIGATSVGFAAVFIALLPVVAAVEPQFATEDLIEKIRPGLTSQAQIVTFPFVQSVSFYANRRVFIVGSPSEIEFGIRQMVPAERKKWILPVTSGAAHKNIKGLESLQAKLQQNVPVYCFLRPARKKPQETRKLLRALQGQAEIVAYNQRFVVIGNRAALALTPAVSTPPALADTFPATSSAAR